MPGHESYPSDAELAELQNPDNWDFENAVIVREPRHTGSVLAVRFTPGEFQALSRAAEAAGKNTVAFVHDVMLAHISASTSR